MRTICLDYGHGGRDPGAIYQGRRESDDNLRLGLIIASRLRKAGVRVVETRSWDEFVSLEARCARANSYQLDYFISLHRNAFRPGKASGIEVYVHPKGSDQTRELAKRIRASLLGLGFPDRGLRERGFYVLRRTRAAALLLELGFIDNERDNRIFDKNLERIGENISQAILSVL